MKSFVCRGGPRAGSPGYRGQEVFAAPPHPMSPEHRRPTCAGTDKSLVIRVIPPPTQGRKSFAPTKGSMNRTPTWGWEGGLGGGWGSRLPSALSPETFRNCRAGKRSASPL